MKAARMLFEVTGLDDFGIIDSRVRKVLSEIDARVLDER
jgi:hypothetical protein